MGCLTTPGCYKKPSKWGHSNRMEKLHRSIKKNHQKILKMKKVRATFWKFLKIFEIENFRKFSLKFVWKWKFLRSKIFENFRSQKFRKFSLKIVWKWKFSRSKIFEIFRSQKFSKIFETFSETCSNFFRFQNFLMIFFSKCFSFPWRRRWVHSKILLARLSCPKRYF